jgi:hypothetical protein
MARAIIAEIDHAELTVRLLEVGIKLTRPPGQSAAQAMRHIHEMVNKGQVPAYIVADFEAMATAAMTYVQDCLNDAEVVQ